MAIRVYNASETKADLYARITSNGEYELLMGANAKEDQEVELWQYDDSSMATDNGTTVIQPTLQTGAGRWLKKGNYPSNKKTFNNTPARSIVTTAASANGFQISAARDASVQYSVTINTSVSLSGNSSGYAVIEICPTNSSTAANWIEVARVPSGQSGTLVIGLVLNQAGGGCISAIVPAGYYVRIRSIDVSGTPSYVMNSGQEVLI